MPTAAEVQTILARADHGQFVLRSADWAKSEVFDAEEPLESIQTKLENLYGIAPNSGLRVGRAGYRYTIVFGGLLAGRPIAQIQWLPDDPRNSLVSDNADVTTDVRTATLRDVVPGRPPAVNNAQTLTVDATTGRFTVVVNGETAFNLETQTITVTGSGLVTIHATLPGHGGDVTFDPTAPVSVLEKALQEAYDTFGVSVGQAGSVYTVVFGGLLAGQDIAPIAVVSGSATVATLADGGTTRWFDVNASADDLLAGLAPILDPNNSDASLPHTRNVAITKIGNVFTLFFQGALAGKAAPAISLVNQTNGSLSLARRVNGIDYYGVETLNIDLGSGDDVFNVQGTTALTNLRLHEGNERIYVSSEANADQGTILDAMESGAVGYLTKDKALIDDVVDAVRRAHAGEIMLPTALIGRLITSLATRRREQVERQDLIERLTAREREILHLIAEGADNKTIADRLVVSPHTVRTHVQNLLAKLGAHSKLEALTIAARRGLVELK